MIVHGRVQGVGFRFFVRQHATALGLSGWVRNLSGGGVEAYAEGDRPAIEEFIGRVKRGPTFGHVDDLDIEWSEPTHSYIGFDITY